MRATIALTAFLAAATAAFPFAASPVGGLYMTERAVVHAAQTQGLTLNDGTRIRPIDGFCIGEGPHKGTYASPRFKRFHCTLVTQSRYATTTWYSLRVFPLTGMLWAVVLTRY